MKVAICTPCHGNPKFDYVASLAALLIRAPKDIPGLDLVHISVENTALAEARNFLAETAIERGADWILWLDADQTFPANTLSRLLAHGKDAVGANYRRRCIQPISAAIGFNGKPLTPGSGLEEVKTLGLGVCLISAKAMKAIDLPAFETTKEDTFLFKKLRAAGIPAFVDHDLSEACGHIAEVVLTLR